MPGVQGSAVRRPEHDLLGIYLNDHLAGATIGLDLARRMARSYRGGAIGEALGPIVIEIAEDRESLKGMMATLGIPVRHYKVYAAWLAEKVTRAKPNGYLMNRSPLTPLVELESLRLGVEGKAVGWRTLREVAVSDHRLDAQHLEALLARARAQADALEDLRVRTVSELFASR